LIERPSGRRVPGFFNQLVDFEMDVLLIIVCKLLDAVGSVGALKLRPAFDK
jgi:hypothetical protein